MPLATGIALSGVLTLVVSATSAFFIFTNRKITALEVRVSARCQHELNSYNNLGKVTYAPLESLHKVELTLVEIKKDVEQILREIKTSKKLI